MPPTRPRRRAKPDRGSLSRAAAWLAVVVSGLALLVCALLKVGPAYLPGIGAVVVSTAYAVALSHRAGGRPVILGGVALLLGAVVVALDEEVLRSGAAVLTATVTGVLAVVATVPARTYLHALREVLVAVLIAGSGALAVVGFEPTVSLERFDYTALALALLLSLGVVFRLGAGLHGLGRRGLLIVVVGSLTLAVTLAYAEALRRYGTTTLREAILDSTTWLRAQIGAVPRPIMVFLGFPALLWGTHMRARRRQGWWVCAFGAAATVSIAGVLMNPESNVLEAALSILYSLLLGLVVGYAVIRADLALTGPRGGRARREEEANAVRPEPARTQPLL